MVYPGALSVCVSIDQKMRTTTSCWKTGRLWRQNRQNQGKNKPWENRLGVMEPADNLAGNFTSQSIDYQLIVNGYPVALEWPNGGPMRELTTGSLGY
jgi:hypothetical protein